MKIAACIRKLLKNGGPQSTRKPLTPCNYSFTAFTIFTSHYALTMFEGVQHVVEGANFVL